MPKTIVQGFQKLRENLEITNLQASTTSTRQTNVREAVESELTVLDSFLTGSYKRNTMIAPLKEADIDIVVVLDAKYYDAHGQATLLDRVKRVLKNTYPKSPRVSRNGQAVTITFTDFEVDVVPAFHRQGGGYLIPDSTQGRWVSTDPKRHVSIWSTANGQHTSQLVPLIKMIKGWNRKHSSLLRSFHLEALVLTVLNGVTISNYWTGARYVFDKARDGVRYVLADPAGYGDNIGGYLTSASLTDAVSRLTTAHERAVAAVDLESNGRTQLAFDKWRLIFGDYFPAYG